MKRRHQRDWSIEEFNAWQAASKRQAEVAAAADEEGGPRLSLVPVTERELAWPTDLLAPAAPAAPDPNAAAAPDPADPAPDPADPPVDPPVAAQPFDGVALPESRNRLAGWSGDRQRVFLNALAETGSVHLASAAARMSARAAYQLRARSPAFAAAWDSAEQLAVGRLSALAFDRAIHGRTEQVWQDGVLVEEKCVPNDKLLMWLLARLDPRRFAAPWDVRKSGDADPQATARQAFPALLNALADLPV